MNFGKEGGKEGGRNKRKKKKKLNQIKYFQLDVANHNLQYINYLTPLQTIYIYCFHFYDVIEQSIEYILIDYSTSVVVGLFVVVFLV